MPQTALSKTVQWSILAPCTGRTLTGAKAASTATAYAIVMMLDCFWCMAPLDHRGVCTSCASVFPVFPDIHRLVTESDQNAGDNPAGHEADNT